ncbi:flavin-nucleotide-binding protein [Synechococcus sp. RSCCF101]|uniref:pyridoxamine 5'-phosphate oxidase family protein n=1 Tax=Synechococcus sp. RSCCF101 TaxID=2511069 RepID=UPI00124850CD|nr:pyridoxamine 5'-phosphate oxidase family protein [Synechococcus sp. RSCCF101]QEY31118.1 flavin-nucleotide-binding protein [Synechococcus sp. RSCCF101]
MVEPGWDQVSSPFHTGELAIQERLGVRQRVDRQGRRVIRPVLTDQHRTFFSHLSYVLVGFVDAAGAPWASIVVGDPGFISSPHPRTLRVASQAVPEDPLASNLHEGGPVGLLGIELSTRRRNRVNGVLDAVGPDGFTVQVEQSFGNCPQYIQVRQATPKPLGTPEPGPVDTVHRFGPAEAALIEAADTVFIATAFMGGAGDAPEVGGVDVSHRGGRPGFVQLDDNRTLTIPDYAGNNHFNTFGNLEMNARAGLLFLDFQSGDLLTLTGTAEVIWEGEEIARFAQAERLLRFQLESGHRIRSGLPLSWSEPEFSPFLYHRPSITPPLSNDYHATAHRFQPEGGGLHH